MRRIGGVWDEITSFPNLLRATTRAARGKRATKGVATFLQRREPELLALQRELIEGTWRPGPPTTFTIHDPKVREITAAPFRDRVVHHALIDVLEPWFDRRMVPHSFACRRGKGQHAALRHAQRLVRRHPWFLKLDVKSFFPSLAHDVVLDVLRRVVKDRRAFALCADEQVRGPEPRQRADAPPQGIARLNGESAAVAPIRPGPRRRGPRGSCTPRSSGPAE